MYVSIQYSMYNLYEYVSYHVCVYMYMYVCIYVHVCVYTVQYVLLSCMCIYVQCSAHTGRHWSGITTSQMN